MIRRATQEPVGVNFDKWNTPLYRANASTPRQTVEYSNCFSNSGPVPSAITNAFRDVPIPAGAKPSPDTDAHMAVYDSSTDRLWEMWNVQVVGGRYRACWGGRIDNASSASGVFAGQTGASASGLSLIATQVSQAEVRAGTINHAVGVVFPNVRAGVWSYPARRTDGTSSDPNAPMEGQLFRLPASINVDALNITPLAKMIARAAQRHGLICLNTGGGVSLHLESSLPATSAGQVDPWIAIMGQRPRGNYRGNDWNQMAGFPWSSLEAVAPNWR